MVTEREHYFDNRTQITKGSNVQDNTASNFDHIIPVDTYVSYLQHFRPFTMKLMFLPLENTQFRNYSMDIHSSRRRTWLKTLRLLTCFYYATTQMYPFHSAWKASTKECFFHLKMMADRDYSFNKQAQFSKGNSVKDAQTSHSLPCHGTHVPIPLSHICLFTVKSNILNLPTLTGQNSFEIQC
jgi:hypothetical protein